MIGILLINFFVSKEYIFMDLFSEVKSYIIYLFQPAIIALIGAVVSGLIALVVSRRSTYLIAVTTERSKWIDKLRENIANLLEVCSEICLSAMCDKNDDQTENCLKAKIDPILIAKADRLIALIQMQLNPNNIIDRDIIILLRDLPKAAEKVNRERYRGSEGVLIMHVQFLLKEEWEKVKFEAADCWSKKKFFRESNVRKIAYQEMRKNQTCNRSISTCQPPSL